MRLRMAVQQQKRRALPAPQRAQASGRPFNIGGDKVFKHLSALMLQAAATERQLAAQGP